MPPGFDDRLAQPEPQRGPHGWFEVFCCGMIVLALVAALVALGLLSR